MTPPSARERLDRRFMAALCLAATAGLVNNAALGPFIPVIADDFDSSVPVIGQAATASWLMAALSGIFAGPLADHYGHRRLLVTGLLLTALSAAGGAAVTGYWTLVLARVVGGLGFSATVGVAFAIATTRYTGGARLRALSVISSSLSFSAILGIPILTAIAGPFSWRGAWVFVALLALAAIVLLVASVPAIPTEREGGLSVRQLGSVYAPLLGSRPMLFLFGGTAFQGVLFIAALTYSASYYVDELGLTVQRFGAVATVTGLFFFLGSLAAGRLGRLDLRLTFAGSTLATGPLLMATFATSDSVVVAAALMSAAFLLAGIQVVNITTLISNETPAGQATTLVINEAIFGLGAAIGAAAGGLLLDLGGFRALGGAMPIFALIATAFVWQPRRTRRRPPAAGPDVAPAVVQQEAP